MAKKSKNTILSKILKFSFVLIIALFINLSYVNSFISVEAGTPDPKAGTPDVKIDMSIKNPLGENTKDLPTFINTILNAVLVVGVPIITLAIIYSGFLFVSARGNPESLTKAKKALVYTLIGAALLLGSFVIANAIKGTVDCIRDNKNTNC